MKTYKIWYYYKNDIEGYVYNMLVDDDYLTNYNELDGEICIIYYEKI